MTGGQYSIIRVLVGIALFLRFMGDLLYDPYWITWLGSSRANWWLAMVGAVASLLFALGKRDKLAALLLLVIVGPASFAAPGSWIFFRVVYVWILVQHLLLPAAPFGSLDAVGRADPAGDWHFYPRARTVSWCLISISAVLGYIGLGPQINPALYFTTVVVVSLLALGAPVLLWQKGRPIAWALLTFLLIGAIVIGGNPELAPSLLLLLFAFESDWLPRKVAASPEYVFYDGSCAFCHRMVRIVLAETPRECSIVFAPRQGELFREVVSEERRRSLPPSIVFFDEQGGLHIKSGAAVALMERMGGLWRIGAIVARCIPELLRNLVYDGISKIRYRLCGKAESVCPAISPELRKKFDLR